MTDLARGRELPSCYVVLGRQVSHLPWYVWRVTLSEQEADGLREMHQLHNRGYEVIVERYAAAERVAALEEALRPFAGFAEGWDAINANWPDDKPLIGGTCYLTIGDMRRARRALAGEKA